jgi:deoxyribodipyrimidine photo-lyase
MRQDLRLSDNPALAAALARRSPVIPVFIWAPEEEGSWPPGAASRWWLHHSLASLRDELEKRGSRLVVRRGPTAAALRLLVAETGASAVLWDRRYEPAAVARDRELPSKLRKGGWAAESGLAVESFNGSLLFEPRVIRNRSGQPFRVFTPFWRAV